MEPVIQEFNSLDLKVFSSDEAHVLFSPETLQLFVLNPTAASVIRDLSTAEDLPSLALQYGIAAENLREFLASTIHAVKTARPVATDKTGTETQNPLSDVLPKLVLMINNYCNLKCTYCYEHETVFKRKPIDMSQLVIETALRKFFEAFSVIGQIMFIGGEPTLSEDCVEHACKCVSHLAAERSRNLPAFAMITNGAHITERMFAIIQKYEIQVTFSIDGPPKVHDLVRIRHDDSGSYDEAAANIRRYRARFPEKLGIECTLTQAHKQAGFSVSDISKFFASEFGVSTPHLAAAGLPRHDPLSPYWGSDSYLERELSDAAAASIRNLFEDLLAQNEPEDRPAQAGLDLASGMLRNLMKRKSSVEMCPAGTLQLVVDSMGDVYPCWMFAGMDGFKMGNILRDDLFNESARKVLGRIFANTKKTNPECSVCYARYVCHACLGNNQNSTGALETMDEHFCNGVRGVLKSILVQIGEARQEPAKWGKIRSAVLQTRDLKGKSAAC